MNGSSFCTSMLHTRHLSRVSAFYERLVGWQFQAKPNAPEHFTITSGAHVVAHAHVTADGAGSWIPQIAVDDLASAVRCAVSLGGGLVSEGAIHGVALVARLRDLEGAEFGLWQSTGEHTVVSTDMIGALWWLEVLTLDVAKATRFYGDLLGWQARVTTVVPFDQYVVFERDGHQEGGALPMDPDWDVSPRWNTIIAVENADEACALAVALGGCVHFVHTVPSAGRIAVLGDPEGAVFVVRGPVPPQAETVRRAP